MTKKQRNIFYKKLLVAICKNPSVKYGLCTYIKKLRKYFWVIDACEFLEYYLPELLAQRPKGKTKYSFWYPESSEGWGKRIRAVEKAIELTNN